jgi:hypothetical protein
VNIDEFKERLIIEGIASIEAHEVRPERRKGGEAGFKLCRSLNTMADFQEALDSRHKEEMRLRTAEKRDREQYWEYRYATVQVEYVYERMLVAWSQMGLYSGPLSARAVLRTAEIVNE